MQACIPADIVYSDDMPAGAAGRDTQTERTPTMRLLTKTVTKTIPALYSQDGKGMDAICHLKLFVPWGGETYYITELDPATGEAFGLAVTPDCPEGELGYFDLNEMQAVRGPFGLGIERDLHFTRKTLRECLVNAA